MIDKQNCLATKPEVKIYKKGQSGLTLVGGGRLAPAWHEETNPKSCAFSEQPGYKAVTGKVPGGGDTETYRVVVSTAGVGASTSSVTRVAKPK